MMLDKITLKDEIMRVLGIFLKYLKENTAMAYQKDITDYLDHVAGYDFKSTLEYFNNLAASGYAKSTINRRRAALSRFFDFLIDMGKIEKNPIKSTTFSLAMKKVNENAIGTRGKKPDQTHLDWHEIEQMLTLCDDSVTGIRNRVIVLLGVYAGLRRSEIANLKFSDIRKDINGYALVIRNAKGGDGEVDIHKRLLKALDELKEAYKHWNITSDYIIISTSNRNFGKPVTGNAINKIIQEISKQAKVSKITAHDLRHTCAVQLLIHNAPVERVSSHLRHKDIATTMTYFKTLNLHEESAMAVLP